MPTDLQSVLFDRSRIPPEIIFAHQVFPNGKEWCSGRDSNPQGSLHMHLKHACLPISPPELRGENGAYNIITRCGMQ